MAISPQSYAVLREFLTAKEPTTQIELSARSGASPSQVSRVVNQLIATGYAERQRDGRYRAIGAPAVVTNLAFRRPLLPLKAGSMHVRASPDDVKAALVREGCILALDSALEAYSSYFRSDRVCAYVEDADRILRGLAPAQGGMLRVELYHSDLPLDDREVEGDHTARFRTLFDLVCDGRAYAGKDLFEQLWGVQLA
jgi:hypothetical protein